MQFLFNSLNPTRILREGILGTEKDTYAGRMPCEDEGRDLSDVEPRNGKDS